MTSARWVQDEHRQLCRTDGYMVIRDVVPPELTHNAAREIAAFVGADLNDSASWYNSPAVLDGLVPLHHAQSLWDIRQCGNLYEAFAEFWGDPHLLVDINRCIFRPPAHSNHSQISYGNIHWDTDPRAPGKGSLQGIVLLTDVGRNGGGYQCLPSVFQNLEAWLAQNARENFDFFNPGLNDGWAGFDRSWIKQWFRVKPKQIQGKAGDLILWSTRLPHGSATNLSQRPRIAMSVSMQPPPADDHYRESLKDWWRTKRAPLYWRGLPGQLDPEPGESAVLSELGLKLIGVLPW